MLTAVVDPPWTASLTDAEHQLLVYGVLVGGLALLATLVRVRFSSQEVHGVYRTTSLTANGVVAIAFAAYVLLAVVLAVGYRHEGSRWVPGSFAVLLWSVRYIDWTVTVPLLVIELIAVSALRPARATVARRTGMSAAALMVLAGFLGALVIDDGTSFAALLICGLVGAACFAVLYGIFVTTVIHSLPLLPTAARGPYRSATLLLLLVWLVYPLVYGLQGVTSGGAWAVIGQLAFTAADLLAKIGFGTLIHRTAVLRSRAEERASPGSPRPRLPQADTIWVDDEDLLDMDSDPDTDSRRTPYR